MTRDSIRMSFHPIAGGSWLVEHYDTNGMKVKDQRFKEYKQAKQIFDIWKEETETSDGTTDT